MAKPAARIGFLSFCLSAALLGVLARSAQLQLVRGRDYAARVARTRTDADSLPARRGRVLDRAGQYLVVSQEQYHLSLAPDQIADKAHAATRIADALGLDRASLLHDLTTRRYVYRHGPFTASQVQPLRRASGVHLEPTERRIELYGDVARATLQLVDLALDSLLDGTAGAAVYVKNSRGQQFESPSRIIRVPVAGHDVMLTIDARLQEIAERTLDTELERMDAVSGDFIFVDPWTGEILAMASRGKATGSGTAVINAPYEPGSTAKLFTAAALLVSGLVADSERVSPDGGRWTVPGTAHVITDDHPPAEPMTLAGAIEHSSNVGMAKFAQRLPPADLYAMLRDFGFGQSTGLLTGDAEGTLPPLDSWIEHYTRESLSRGYGLAVTPLQLAMAYGAIANGGVLMSPALVREIRAPDGTVIYRHRPEPVRRVVSPAIAAKLRDYLRGAVSASGTGSNAQIQGYELIAKTGTARMVKNGRYVAGAYASSLASIWPASDPQLVALVKVDEPRRGSIYGGQTAAPITRKILEETIASRNDALELPRLARADAVPTDTTAPVPVAGDAPVPTRLVTLDSTRSTPTDSVAVPDVVGSPLRVAARRIFGEGLAVRATAGGGLVTSVVPAPGTRLARGAVIELTMSEGAR